MIQSPYHIATTIVERHRLCRNWLVHAGATSLLHDQSLSAGCSRSLTTHHIVQPKHLLAYVIAITRICNTIQYHTIQVILASLIRIIERNSGDVIIETSGNITTSFLFRQWFEIVHNHAFLITWIAIRHNENVASPRTRREPYSGHYEADLVSVGVFT